MNMWGLKMWQRTLKLVEKDELVTSGSETLVLSGYTKLDYYVIHKRKLCGLNV
jgi:hypothetical protein